MEKQSRIVTVEAVDHESNAHQMKVFFESNKQSLFVELTASNIDFFQRVVSHQVAQADEKSKKIRMKTSIVSHGFRRKALIVLGIRSMARLSMKMFQAGEDKEQALQNAIVFRDNNQ